MNETENLEARRDYFRSLPRAERQIFLEAAQGEFGTGPLTKQQKRAVVRRAWKLAELESEREAAEIFERSDWGLEA